jgi:hypothetical protein
MKRRKKEKASHGAAEAILGRFLASYDAAAVLLNEAAHWIADPNNLTKPYPRQQELELLNRTFQKNLSDAREYLLTRKPPS